VIFEYANCPLPRGKLALLHIRAPILCPRVDTLPIRLLRTILGTLVDVLHHELRHLGEFAPVVVGGTDLVLRVGPGHLDRVELMVVHGESQERDPSFVKHLLQYCCPVPVSTCSCRGWEGEKEVGRYM
jgi:hypothetical protein